MTEVKVQRLSTDPFCTRVSIGGNRKIGFYCLYRGTREEAIEAVEKVLLVLQHMPEQPIEPDDAAIGMS